MKSKTWTFLKKTLAAALSAAIAAALGPVPQAMAAAKAAVENRASGATKIALPARAGQAAGLAVPSADLGVGLGAALPSAPQTALPGISAPAADARPAEAVSPSAENASRQAMAEEFQGVRDALNAMPEASKAGAASAHASGWRLLDLITRSKSVSGDDDLVAAPSAAEAVPGIARRHAAPVVVAAGPSVPSPRRSAAAFAGAVILQPERWLTTPKALALAGLGVAFGLALAQAWAPAAATSLVLLLMAGSLKGVSEDKTAVTGEKAAQWVDQAQAAVAAKDPELEAKVKAFGDVIGRFNEENAKVMVGQKQTLEYIVASIIAGGHILLESVPGLAKTTAVKTVASTTGASFKRIQGTPDLLPKDVVGYTKIDLETGKETFQQGPIFGELVLFDEGNRVPPKTKAAVLEAMQERQVTIDGVTHKLPDPFLLMMTQNPIEQEGTYPLSEAEQDRFMFKVVLADPSRDELAEIAERFRRKQTPSTSKVVSIQDLQAGRELADSITMDLTVKNYILDIVEAARKPMLYGIGSDPDMVQTGPSPRAVIFLNIATRVRALMQGRDFATIEDVKSVAPEILRHRIRMNYNYDAKDVEKLLANILKKEQAELVKQAAPAAQQAEGAKPASGSRRWFKRLAVAAALLAVTAAIGGAAWHYWPAIGAWISTLPQVFTPHQSMPILPDVVE